MPTAASPSGPRRASPGVPVAPIAGSLDPVAGHAAERRNAPAQQVDRVFGRRRRSIDQVSRVTELRPTRRASNCQCSAARHFRSSTWTTSGMPSG
jgi:hypothetical protein